MHHEPSIQLPPPGSVNVNGHRTISAAAASGSIPGPPDGKPPRIFVLGGGGWWIRRIVCSDKAGHLDVAKKHKANNNSH